MDHATLRHQTIAESILLSLAAVWEAMPGAVIRAADIYDGLAKGSEVPPTDSEARAAIADLIERKLIESSPSVVPSDVPQKCYQITPRGRDFVAHKFPWNLIDEFAGNRNS